VLSGEAYERALRLRLLRAVAGEGNGMETQLG